MLLQSNPTATIDLPKQESRSIGLQFESQSFCCFMELLNILSIPNSHF